MDSNPSEVPASPKGPKPRLRGVSHLIAAIAAVPAMLSLAQSAGDTEIRGDVLTYGVCLILLFAVSALYHVPMWTPTVRSNLRRLDRSMIYVFVAGTYAPLLSTLEGNVPTWLSPAVWTAAGLGIALSILFTKLPRYITATPYVVLGWGAVIMMPAVMEQFGHLCFWLISAGGVLYTIGAIIYAKRTPNPWPRTFGYHEIFHLLVIGASITHYLGIRVAVEARVAVL